MVASFSSQLLFGANFSGYCGETRGFPPEELRGGDEETRKRKGDKEEGDKETRSKAKGSF
jgi:hypothetical protein